MPDVNAQNWNAIFYGEGHQDVQLTNQLYEQRYGKTGTTVGYTNTVDNPATTANPGAMSAQAYNNTPVYTDAAGTQQAYNVPIQGPGLTYPGGPPAGSGGTVGGSTSQSGTTQSTTQTPTSQGQVPNLSPQELLKRFLESDPDLMLNMVANHFREMGASNVFMQWFVGSFRQLWGEFLGHVAEMAANGQVPNLSFADWVQQFDTNQAFYANGGARQGAGQTSATYANFVKAQGAQ